MTGRTGPPTTARQAPGGGGGALRKPPAALSTGTGSPTPTTPAPGRPQRAQAAFPPRFFLLLICLAMGGAAFADPSVPLPGLAAADLVRLEAGETVVRMEGEAGEVGEGWAWRILEVPAERLFRAVADWRHYAEFFPFVEASEVEVDEAGRVFSLQRIDLPFPFADRTFRAATTRQVEATPEGPAYRVTWNRVPGFGNVTENRGGWTLRELAPGRTLVELRLLSDAGPTVPPALQRRALAETLPWALEGLRQQVNRCRYDVPIHPTCEEAPPTPAGDAAQGGGEAREGDLREDDVQEGGAASPPAAAAPASRQKSSPRQHVAGAAPPPDAGAQP